MKKILLFWIILIVFIYMFIGTQNICHGLEFDVAEPVPGFSPTLWITFNYVNTDANFMLLQVWDPYWRIESSTWDQNTQQWTSPQQLPTDPPGGFPTGTGIASLSPDGTTMFYGAEGYSGVCRSWWTPNGWTLPPKTDPNLDPLASDTYFNGEFLYTSHFYFDIWVSTYDDANGQFSPSVPVESITTSEWSEQGAWISSDSSLLIFCSDRPGGYGLHDLYSATWDENLKIWTNITNLGPNVNTSLDEYNSCMAEKAGILFFERIDPNTGHKRQPMQAFLKSVSEPIRVKIDIKPGSCPNPLSVKSQGVLPVAILGSEDFDVNSIDAASIRLAGVAPIRSSYEDVSTPASDANECECSTAGPDGFPDLTLKFETQMIVDAIGEVDHGDELVLELTGTLSDETLIEGCDCIIIRGEHKLFNKGDINKKRPYH